MPEDISRMKGVFANMPTAFQDDGTFDQGRMGDHIEWLLSEGVHGIGCLLSSGEFTYLNREERRQVLSAVVEVVAGRVPVLGGVSADNTEATIELANDAADVGVDAAMVQPRSYIPLVEDEVIRHYSRVASSVSVPLGIYNNPPTTGFTVTPAVYNRILDEVGALVTKDGSGELFNVPEVIADSGDRMGYLWGTEYLILPAFAAGAHGVCVAFASVFPGAVIEIYEAVLGGDLDAARAAYRRVLPILRAFKTIGTPRAVKGSARILGRSLGPHRTPLGDLPGEHEKLLRGAIEEAEALNASAA